MLVERHERPHKHPAVLQAAVIGTPDDKWGEAVTALIVQREGVATSEAEIKTFCGEAVARYKVPKKIVFVDSLPLSASGKILKYQLSLYSLRP